MPHQGHPPDLLGSEERLSHQNQGLVQAGGPWKVTILQGLSWSGTWDSQAGSHRPPLLGWAGLPLGALHKVPATPSAAICLVHVIWGGGGRQGAGSSPALDQLSCCRLFLIRSFALGHTDQHPLPLQRVIVVHLIPPGAGGPEGRGWCLVPWDPRNLAAPDIQVLNTRRLAS